MSLEWWTVMVQCLESEARYATFPGRYAVRDHRVATRDRRRLWRSVSLSPSIFQIPPDSYGNAVPGCFHAGAGAGPACMNDLVVNPQSIDIVEVIL